MNFSKELATKFWERVPTIIPETRDFSLSKEPIRSILRLYRENKHFEPLYFILMQINQEWQVISQEI